MKALGASAVAMRNGRECDAAVQTQVAISEPAALIFRFLGPLRCCTARHRGRQTPTEPMQWPAQLQSGGRSLSVRKPLTYLLMPPRPPSCQGCFRGWDLAPDLRANKVMTGLGWSSSWICVNFKRKESSRSLSARGAQRIESKCIRQKAGSPTLFRPSTPFTGRSCSLIHCT